MKPKKNANIHLSKKIENPIRQEQQDRKNVLPKNQTEKKLPNI